MCGQQQRQQHIQKAHASYFVAGGLCEKCNGLALRISMLPLSELVLGQPILL